MSDVICLLMKYIPIKTKDFAENQDQDHANKDPGLLHIGTNTTVTNNSDAVTSSKTCHANCDTASKMHKAPITVDQYSCLAG